MVTFFFFFANAKALNGAMWLIAPRGQQRNKNRSGQQVHRKMSSLMEKRGEGHCESSKMETELRAIYRLAWDFFFNSSKRLVNKIKDWNKCSNEKDPGIHLRAYFQEASLKS